MSKAKNDIPKSWRKKFAVWGRIGGKRGSHEAKSRAGAAGWAPGGGNHHRLKSNKALSSTTADAEVQAAINQVRNA